MNIHVEGINYDKSQIVGRAISGDDIKACLIIDKLARALRYAESRLNAIPHDYEETNFRLIREALADYESEIK